MKKAILITLCALISVMSIAQSRKKREQAAMATIDRLAELSKKQYAKEDSIKNANPVFTVDPQKVYQIPLTLNAEMIYAITLTPEDWAQIKASPKLSGQQITQLEKLAAGIRQAIITIQQQAIQKDYETFNAASKAVTVAPPKN